MQTKRILSMVLSIATVVLLACAITARSPVALAETWRHKGGGEVSIDRQTNRATIKRNGVETQLWDGVHELENGGTITVRDGQVVPSREIIDSRRQPVQPEVIDRTHDDLWTGVPIFRQSPCEKLVERVCGKSQACADSEACSMSRQLLDFESRERAASRMHNLMTRASGECLEADVDDTFFATCTR